MKRFKVSVIWMIAMIMVLQILLPTVSLAVDEVKLNIQYERPYSDDNGDGTIGNDIYTVIRAAIQTVFKIGEQGEDNKLTFNTAYYCLRAGLGFGSTEEILENGVDYRVLANFKNKDEIIAYYKDVIGYDIPVANYNALCWIADNMYLPKSEYKDDLKAKLLNNAGITDLNALTDDDIEVIQQIALWYFSNYDQNGESNSLSLADSVDIVNALRVAGESIRDERAEAIRTLYKYFINSAKNVGDNYEVEHTTAKIELDKTLNPTIKMSTTGRNKKAIVGPFKINQLQNAKNAEFSFDYTIQYKSDYEQTTWDNLVIDNSTGTVMLSDENGNAIDRTKTIKDMIGQEEFYLSIIMTPLGITNISDLKIAIDYESYYYVTTATLLVAGNEDQTVLKVEKTKVEDKDEDEVTTIPEELKEFDLSLAKFISTAAGKELTGENNREPKLVLANLRDDSVQNPNKTSQKYPGSKKSITLKIGDKIVYTIRIYNEGEVDGFATEITDYLSPELEFIPATESTINTTYGWTVSDDGRKVSTNYLKDTLIKAYDPEITSESARGNWQPATDGNDGLYYADVQIECRIKDNAQVGYVIPNIAAITGDKAVEENVKDRDSHPLDSIKEDDLRNYNITHYYEDDDDYELVEIEPEKIFDLALRKYITKVNDTNLVNTRIPNIDTQYLDAGTEKTACYAHRKDPVEVEPGDMVTYNITIYNEGEQAGRATKIIDQLPRGLKFIEIISGNYELDSYNETTNELKLKEKNTNTDLLPKAEERPFDNTSSTTVELKCQVTAAVTDEDQVLTNIAWISEEYNAETNTVITNQTKADRDSEPYTAPNSYSADDLNTQDIGYTGNNNKEDLSDKNYFYKGGQDDDDFEKVIVKTLNGSYDIVLVKEDAEGEQLNDTATFEVNGVSKQVTGRLTIIKDKKITPSTVDIIDTYIIKETVPPDEYCAFNGVIKIEVYKKKDGQRYVVDTIKYYVDDVEVVSNREDLDVYLNTDGNIYVEVKDYQFDLALRKFISDIERKGNKVEFASREPKIDTSKLNIIDETTGEKNTTARYIHPKNTLTAKHGDIITYTLRVYNEGELDGFVSKITDYIPEGLGVLIGTPGYTGTINTGWKIASNENDINYKLLVGENGWYENVEEIPQNSMLLEDASELYIVTGKNGANVELEYTLLANKLIKKYGAQVNENDKWQKSENDDNDGLFYQEVEITCIVLAENTYEGTIKNIAEISEDKAQDDFENEIDVDDRDSEVDNVWDDEEHTPGTEDNGYTPGEQDDDDFEPIQLKYFDLALRKFITEINNEELSEEDSREPVFTGEIDEYGNYVYEHSKNPIYVLDKDIVTYTIRVFNEGTIAGYAEEIEDDIPEGLIFLPENDTNKEYRWVMYKEVEEDEDLEGKTTVEKNGKTYVETDDVEKATIIRTDYLSEANGKIDQETGMNSNLLKAFNRLNMESPDYRDVKVAFKVSQSDIPEDNTERIIINKAHITEDSDDDEDSIPNEWNDHEDDQDYENIYVKEFDLAIFKWVTKTIVTVDGKTTTTETGFKPNIGHTEANGVNYRENSEPEPIASVTIDKKKLNKTVVKFVYNVKVVNEGDIEGYATELTDYIPEGLEFKAEDNPLWKLGDKEGTITTRALETVLLKPGQSATIQVVFTWKNSEDNLGLKTNVVAITEDYNEYQVEDIDSIPGNEDRENYDKEQEDDDDYALVILTLKTGKQIEYIGLTIAVITILGLGVVSIKKYVL